KARLAEWLAPKGLTFNEDKTCVVTLEDGFDFLGFTVRRQSGKLLIKPSKAGSWIVSRYFGAFNRSRRDRWVFGDRDSGAYLAKFAWTKIVRHHLVKG